MRNKRAQIFSLILVFITLFMCGSSIYIYMIQQESAESSLVSPLAVLEIRDNLTIFEMGEKELIEKSLNEVGAEFGTGDFLKEFRDTFIEGLDGEMKEFILGDLTWRGETMDVSLGFDESSFLNNIVYPEIKKEEEYDEFVFVRSKIGKSISLNAKETIKVNFPVDFKFEFERKYLINKKDGKFEIGVV